MIDKTKVIEDIVYSNPQLLLAIEDSEKIGLAYLPYSVGIEIECDQGATYSLESFTAIPNILNVLNDTTEQRYRIPAGLDGLVCLYQICDLLKEQCIPTASGIHIHIDFTGHYEGLTKEFIDQEEDYILTELDTWSYKGTYNKRGITGINNRQATGAWVRFQQGFQTMEIRIVEMSFQYSVLINRIIHACKIASKLKNRMKLNREVLNLQNTLRELETKIKPKSECDNEDIDAIIRNRLIKI